MSITTQTGKVVVNSNLIPYIREKEVEFVAHNLKPYKISRIFFDDVVVNGFCQSANKIVLDSKKIVGVTANSGSSTIKVGDIAYQGVTPTNRTFSAIVASFDTTTSTITLNALEGEFDQSAQLFVEDKITSTFITYANCNVESVTNFQTSDSFFPGEGIVAPAAKNAYATVISTAGENVLYIKQNYINLDIDKVGANSLSFTHFTEGDIVYQSSTGAERFDLASFTGIVKYFDINSKIIAIEPINGTVVVNNSPLDTLFNASKSPADTKPLQVLSFVKNNFRANGFVRSAINTSINIGITNYLHKSGVVGNNAIGANSNQLIIAANTGANIANGNLIYFTAGSGVGEIKRVVSVDAETLTLNTALSFLPTCNTKYSLGNFIVDEYGSLAGLFNIPAFQNFKFKTGNRIFTITDTDRHNDPDYTMRAAAVYAASGILNTTQRIQTSPVLAPLPEVNSDALVNPVAPADRGSTGAPVKAPVTGSTATTIPRIPLGDGMAQTFFTPKPNGNKQDYGIYCSSIDLFFKSKPSVARKEVNSVSVTRSNLQLPITVKIAEVQNGFPTKNYIAQKTIQAKDVLVSDLPNVDDPSTATKFTFDDPVYLEPNREYAIVVGSDSPEYELYIAELGDDVLGSFPVRRISEQPYAGSFFRSQNSSTWTPYQNQDLMFVLNKAIFEDAGTVTFALDTPPVANIDIDRIMLTSSDLKFPVGLLDYRVRGIYSATNLPETTGVYLSPHKTIEFGTLLDKSNKLSTNSRKLVRGNANSFLITAEMSSADQDISPILNKERLGLSAVSFLINNAGLSNTKISLTNAGTGYLKTASNTVAGSSNTQLADFSEKYRELVYASDANIGFYNLTFSGGNGAGATGFAVANTDGSNTVNHIVLYSYGSRYTTTPTVTIQDPPVTTGNTTARALVAGEDGKSGGNILAKYITREIILEDGFESGDLRVFMDAIRPTGTDILVYYKVLSGDDPETISDKTWKLMSIVKDNYSRNPNTFIGLEYRPSLTENRISYTENGLNYPIGGTFKNFQIKVCMISSDSSLIPRVKNLRISAVPEG